MQKNSENSKTNLYKNIFFLGAILCTLILALYALHDLQTAEGAGLYLSILYGHSSRLIFDILVDVMGMLLFLAVLLLPCLFLRCLNPASIFRLFACYLAFMPIVHPGNAVHLFEVLFHLQLRDSLLTHKWGHFLYVDCLPLFELIPLLVTLLLLLTFAGKQLGLHTYCKMKLFLPVLFILVVLFLLFDSIAETALYLICYILLIGSFAASEALCKKSPRFANWSLILFTGCLLRGIYRLLEVISHAHI